jgi:arylsulfatase A-like enzyme
MLPGFLSKKVSQARVPQGMGTLSNKTFLKKTTDIALEQVASSIRAGMKFFAFVHYWATHAPYLATPSQMALIKSIEEKLGLSQRLAETSVDVALLNAQIPSYRLYLSLWFKIMNHRTLRDVVASYYASLINVDHEVGRLMELIDGEGATDEVIFVFAGDHGEGLSEHGVYFSHHALYDTTIKVPILLAGVSLGKAMAGAPVSHTDIVPTLLSALGQSRPGLKFDGYDLLSLEGDSDSLADRPMVAVETLLEKKVSVTQRGRKLIRALSSEAALCKLCQKVHGGSMSELYDLATDPSETRNETGSNPDQMKRLEPLAQRAMFVLRTREAMLRANPVAQLKGRPR